MTVLQKQVAALRKAFVVSKRPNRIDGRRCDEELTRRCTVSVSELGNQSLESELQTLLEVLDRETLCHLNIDVHGRPDRAAVIVHVWSHKMYLMMELDDLGGDATAAILGSLTDLVDDFRSEPKLEQGPPPQIHALSHRTS